jgi:hypothetical protein
MRLQCAGCGQLQYPQPINQQVRRVTPCIPIFLHAWPGGSAADWHCWQGATDKPLEQAISKGTRLYECPPGKQGPNRKHPESEESGRTAMTTDRFFHFGYEILFAELSGYRLRRWADPG